MKNFSSIFKYDEDIIITKEQEEDYINLNFPKDDAMWKLGVSVFGFIHDIQVASKLSFAFFKKKMRHQWIPPLLEGTMYAWTFMERVVCVCLVFKKKKNFYF